MKNLYVTLFFILFSCQADPLIVENEEYIISDDLNIIFCENNITNNGDFIGCYIDECIAIDDICYYENDINILSDFINHNNLIDFSELELGTQLWSYGRLFSLKINNLSLTNVPENIGDLVTLIELDLSSNELDSIPESIGDLIQLSILNLNNNQLTSLPESICNIPCDCNINVENNNICDEYDFECLIDLNNQNCN